MKYFGYPFRLNEEIIKLQLVFSNESFNEYKKAPCNKQVIMSGFRDKGAMLLKCESTPVKVDLWYTLISNSLANRYFNIKKW